MYQDNPFHNFQHASHVTASVKKLLTRIVNMDEGNGLGKNTNHSDHVDLVDLAGHSYGITSDPLTQFAVVFSAIVHDLDHPGVPNSQLVRENTRSAQVYKKSVAEQNSVEIAWDMLMGDEYKELRACIYQTEAQVKRFRQLVVNTVMATDIADKDLQALRKAIVDFVVIGRIVRQLAFSTGRAPEQNVSRSCCGANSFLSCLMIRSITFLWRLLSKKSQRKKTRLVKPLQVSEMGTHAGSMLEHNCLVVAAAVRFQDQERLRSLQDHRTGGHVNLSHQATLHLDHQLDTRYCCVLNW